MELTKDPNQLYGVPLSIYQDRFRAANPEEISRRTGIVYDAATGVFTLTVLGFTVLAAWPEFALTPGDPEECPHELCGTKAQILLIRHLLEGSLADASTNFIPYRDLPWGSVYDRQFTGRCITRLAFAFGFKLEQFGKACALLHGTPHNKGDVGYDLPFLPGITVRLQLWAGDDEFPPQTQWLFTDTISQALSTEDVACMGDVICGTLKEVTKKL